MEKIIVLVTKGKHEDVAYARVHLFENLDAARSYIKSVKTGKTKHWMDAQIVSEGEDVELYQPEEE